MEITISKLNKNFGSKTALEDVNLQIKNGMFGLLGRNGAGKTTLMRILTTLLTKTSGNISICGIPIERTREIRRIVGYLPQDFSMYPNMTVYDAMDYIGVLSEIPLKVRRRIVPELLDKVNLYDCQKVRIRALSGGMKRRLGIAQAIIHDPKVLIVDEPTAGLDPEERVRFKKLLKNTSENKIVILSTHIIEDIEETCENVAILNNGRVIYNGNTEKLATMDSSNSTILGGYMKLMGGNM